LLVTLDPRLEERFVAGVSEIKCQLSWQIM